MLIRAFTYTGHDTDSSTDDERNAISRAFNTALTHAAGFNFWFYTIRVPTTDYIPSSQCYYPDEITKLIDNEHRVQFQQDETYFKTQNIVVIGYLPPLNRQTWILDAMFEAGPEAKTKNRLNEHMAHLNKAVENFKDRLDGILKIKMLESYAVYDQFDQMHHRDELTNFLNFLITGLIHTVNIPKITITLDHLLGGQELRVGDVCKIGDKYITAISLEGFPNQSFPNMLAKLEALPLTFIWCNRFLAMEKPDSDHLMKRTQRKWKQGQRSILAQTFKIQTTPNQDAIDMTNQMDAALYESDSGSVVYGHYTPSIILMDEDIKKLKANARFLVREIQREGFNARIETVNTMAAWLGTLPGHTEPNVRRIMIHSRNLADIIPLSTIWTGSPSCPCPFYPDNSPALAQTVTIGSSFFHLNLHVGDVGHTVIFGPTGAGKSTLNVYLAAQFRRYKNGSIFAFDKGNSMWALASATDGRHYDIGSDDSPCFTPLSDLESPGQMSWAEEWIANCFELQTGHAPTPYQRETIHNAMLILKDATAQKHRSLSDFVSQLQDDELRAALNYYTHNGVAGKLLDSEEDGLKDHPFVVMEIEELMAMGNKIAIPVLLYLFRRFEKSLKGQPALLILDEAWVMLGHPVFREKIREWLKVLRKANCSVVMATQSLSDAVKSGIFDVILESCPTKILLPNEEADKTGTDQHPGPKDLYMVMGLNETQIQIIKNAQKKRQYYYISPLGKRLFELELGPAALAFCAVSDKETLAHLKRLKSEHGKHWPYIWMKEKGVSYES
jgi:type IV secretion system protein VirB4